MPRVLLAVTFALLVAGPAAAQFGEPPPPIIQGGLTLGPGVGLQAGALLPTLGAVTREGVFYADYRFGDREEQRLLVGLGVGGSLRALRIATVVLDLPQVPYDIDLGFRFGPSFAFSFVEETAATQARQFRLFGDPFVRGTLATARGATLYGELGIQPGSLRFGLLFGG